jgi:hypothetical protein
MSSVSRRDFLWKSVNFLDSLGFSGLSGGTLLVLRRLVELADQVAFCGWPAQWLGSIGRRNSSTLRV